MTVETTSGLVAFKTPVATLKAAAPPMARPRPIDDKPWSARTRLGIILSGALLSWMMVIIAGVEAVRLIAHLIR